MENLLFFMIFIIISNLRHPLVVEQSGFWTIKLVLFETNSITELFQFFQLTALISTKLY